MTLDSAYQSAVGRIPNWVGFGLIIIAGVAAIVVGAILPLIGLIAFGVAAIISAIIAWYAGAKSTPDVNPVARSFGGTVKAVPALVWLVVFGLFLVASLVTIFTR